MSFIPNVNITMDEYKMLLQAEEALRELLDSSDCDGYFISFDENILLELFKKIVNPRHFGDIENLGLSCRGIASKVES